MLAVFTRLPPRFEGDMVSCSNCEINYHDPDAINIDAFLQGIADVRALMGNTEKVPEK